MSSCIATASSAAGVDRQTSETTSGRQTGIVPAICPGARARRRWPWVSLTIAAASLLGSCGVEAPPLPPTRGYILISIDTLRADHLSSYGYDRPTSPFLDSLADRGLLFENAIVQYPSTLVSHMSIFTGLYPAEHGVYNEDAVLSEDIATLPEVFQRDGFATAAFTEGGFMRRRYGFARGFDTFNARVSGRPTDIEKVLQRGTEFLRGLHTDDRFFLFLHTYAVHTPYSPPVAYRALYWPSEPPETFPPVGPQFIRLNAEGQGPSPEALAYFVAQYDGSINYVDDQLRGFFDTLEDLGLIDDVTVIVTSDHGEEFLDHGKMVHTQIYDDTTRVPLILVHPQGPKGARVRSLVQSIDLAPTVLELAGLSFDEDISGQSLTPLIRDHEAKIRDTAYAENRRQRALYKDHDAGLYELVVTTPRDGEWFSRRLTFDTWQESLQLEVSSFEQPRILMIEINGDPVRELTVDPAWSTIEIELPRADRAAAGKNTVTLSTDGCRVPSGTTRMRKWQCFGFQVRGPSLRRRELFLAAPPAAADASEIGAPGAGAVDELSRSHGRLAGKLESELDQLHFRELAPPMREVLDAETEARLRALGYLQ